MGKIIDKLHCDFSGYVTAFNKKCADGRTILECAFDDNDGKIVPLVYQHNHNDINNVLGHGILEKKGNKGIYGYFDFNDTPMGRIAKEQVRHGDLGFLSIWANELNQDANRNVSHGDIKEVSLVLAGANPGAFIDNVYLSHSADGDESQMIYYSPYSITEFISHGCGTSKKKKLENADMEGETLDETDETNDINEEPNGSKTIKEIWDTLTDEQKNAVAKIIELALKEKENLPDNISHDGMSAPTAESESESESESENDTDEYDDNESEDEVENEDEKDEEEDEDWTEEDIDIDDEKTILKVTQIANNFTDEQIALVNAICDIAENGDDDVTLEEAEAILKEYDNMTGDQQWAVTALVKTYFTKKGNTK